MFDRYVRKLNQEAEARQVPVVTREGYAPYRIKRLCRGLESGAGRRRCPGSGMSSILRPVERMRLSGEEKASKAGRDAWAAVN